MTATRFFVLWLLAALAVFKFTTTALSAMVGLGAVIAFPVVANLALEMRRAARVARISPLLRSEHLLFDVARGATAAMEFLEMVGDDGVHAAGWTQPEVLAHANTPHVFVRNETGDRLAMTTMAIDPVLLSIPAVQVWPDGERVDEWVACRREAIGQLGRILVRGYGSLATYVPTGAPSDGVPETEVPDGFADVGRFLRRTASGDREEVRCFVNVVDRRSSASRRGRAALRRARRVERPMGLSLRAALPLGIVDCGVAAVRPMTRFDGVEVAALIDRAMLEGSDGSLSANRRKAAAWISNGWWGQAFVVVRSGSEEVIGVARIDRMLTDARSCGVRIELRADHRGRGTELAATLGLSERLRVLNVDFLMVAVSPEFGFGTDDLTAHGFVAIGERPSRSERGDFTMVEWFERDLRAGATSHVPPTPGHP